MFGGDWEQIDFGPSAGAGRPGQIIRLHPKTRQRHMDWLTWGLMPASTACDRTGWRSPATGMQALQV